MAKKSSSFSLVAKNTEQKEVLKALFDPEIHLVTITGSAGSGKTLLATYAGLAQTEQGVYEKTIVSRPIIPMGKEIGFLPGTLEEKLAPWTQPIFDSVEALIRMGRDGKKGKGDKLPIGPQNYIAAGMLEIEALMYIRGRSIPGVFLIIDEAQNLTPHEIKTVITRASAGTKIVLTGDCDQIDTKGLTKTNNGLAHAVERLKGEPLVKHFHLSECVRSPLADLGVKKL